MPKSYIIDLQSPEWQEHQRENRELLAKGWKLGSGGKVDGTVEDYAEKDGVRIIRHPPYKREH